MNGFDTSSHSLNRLNCQPSNPLCPYNLHQPHHTYHPLPSKTIPFLTNQFTCSCCSVMNPQYPACTRLTPQMTPPNHSSSFQQRFVTYTLPVRTNRSCLEFSRCTDQLLPPNGDRRYTFFVVHCCMNHCWCTRRIKQQNELT